MRPLRVPTSGIFARRAAFCWIGALVLGACGVDDEGDQRGGTEQFPPQPTPDSTDFSALAPGDTLLGLRVDSMRIAPNPIDSFGYMGRMDYSGATELAGEYRPHMDAPDVAETCFFVDDSLAGRLPRFPNDVRRPWLCFSNQQQAADLLGEVGTVGRARIRIDRYHYLYEHTDVYNRARLTSAEILL